MVPACCSPMRVWTAYWPVQKIARRTRPTTRASTLDDRLTANARPLASRQDQQLQSHIHTSLAVGIGNGSLNAGAGSYALYGAGLTGPTGGPETRPMNTAYYPRLHW